MNDSGTYNYANTFKHEKVEITVTKDQLSVMSLDELKTIYEATFGIIPTRTNINLVAIFMNELSFGRKLYTYA